MLEVRVTTVGKARRLIREERSKSRKRRKKSPIIEEYETYLMNLERGKAITIALKEDDKYQTIKYRLNSAAKSLGIKNLKIERAGDKVILYREARPRAAKVEEHEPELWRADDELVEEQHPHELEGEPSYEAEEEPEEVLEFDFDEEWEAPMIHGYKTCETTVGRFSGDTFEAFGHYYVITSVESLQLREVQQKWFKEHGLFSPREFQEVWKQNHGGAFDPEQMVWLHHFGRGLPDQGEGGYEGELNLDDLEE